jgi:hypothetical protein
MPDVRQVGLVGQGVLGNAKNACVFHLVCQGGQETPAVGSTEVDATPRDRFQDGVNERMEQDGLLF